MADRAETVSVEPLARIPWDGRDGEEWRLSVVMCTDWDRAAIVRFIFDEREKGRTAEVLWYDEVAPPLTVHDHESEEVTVITETLATFRRKAAGLPCFEKTLEADEEPFNRLPPEEDRLDEDSEGDPEEIPEIKMV